MREPDEPRCRLALVSESRARTKIASSRASRTDKTREGQEEVVDSSSPFFFAEKWGEFLSARAERRLSPRASLDFYAAASVTRSPLVRAFNRAVVSYGPRYGTYRAAPNTVEAWNNSILDFD